MGGLFLLSRRSQGGMGGGPGGNNAMNLGKSQAKFQMEPNTGINFDDVAGVEEAKNDFMEVCVPARRCALAQRLGHSGRDGWWSWSDPSPRNQFSRARGSTHTRVDATAASLPCPGQV